MFQKPCFFKKHIFVWVSKIFTLFIFHAQTPINREIRRCRFENCLTFCLPLFLRKVMLVQSRPSKMGDLVLKGLKIFRMELGKGEKGYIFVALKGEKLDGKDFITEAQKNGALLILAENLSMVRPFLTDYDSFI